MTPPDFAGGKVKCPVCQSKFMCDESGVSYKCVSSDLRNEAGSRRGIKPRKKTYSEMKRSVTAAHFSEFDGSRERNSDDVLCFWLGFFLSVVGLLIAAVVSKGDGVRKAIKGFLFGIGAWIVMAILVSLLSKVH